MRQVLYLIVEVNNEHVKELVDSTYPILTRKKIKNIQMRGINF